MGSERLAGAMWIAVSAVSFGAMAIFARFAREEGADVVAVLCLRFVIASIVMTGVMLVRRLRWPSPRNVAILAAMGGVGYVGQSYCFFSALDYASAGLVALLLYLYPILVTLLGALFLRQRLDGARVVAVLAALAGTGLTIGGTVAGSATGVALGAAAALIYSVYILIGSRVMNEVAPLAAATVVMIAAAIVFVVLAAWSDPAWPRAPRGWGAVVAIALVSTVVAMVGFFVGVKKLGAADAAALSTLEPVVTFLLAAIFLGEAILPQQVAGGAIVLGAVIWLVRAAPAPAAGDGRRARAGVTSSSRTG